MCATDNTGFHVVDDPVPVRGLQATILLLQRLNHERWSFHRPDRDFRLTDVSGKIVRKLLC
jgi:hypothetical protein